MRVQRLLNLGNPIVRDHRVLGRHVLPGLAYIDLIFQAFRKHGHDFRCLELRRVSIYQPLVIHGEQGVLLDVECVESRPGRWEVTVEGRLQDGAGVDAERKRYVTAEMHRVEAAEFAEALDGERVTQSATHVLPMAELYAAYRQKGLIHDAFMQATGRLYVTDSAIHVYCGLNDAASAGAEHLMFHPALLDGSVVCGGAALVWLEKSDQRQLAVPLFYESFRASELLQHDCIARVQRASIRHVHGLSYCTLEFFNGAGRKVAELQNIASKPIRDPASIDPDAPAGPAATSRTNSGSAAAATAIPSNRPAGQRHAAAHSAGESLLRRLVAEKLHRNAEQIDTNLEYFELGLASGALLELVQAVEAELGTTLSPTLLFEYGTISQLAAHLVEAGHLRETSDGHGAGEVQRVPESGSRSSRHSFVFRGDEPFLRDHLVFDKPALMGVTHPCLVLDSYVNQFESRLPIQVRNIRFRGGPVIVEKGERIEVSVSFSTAAGRTSFKVERTTTNDAAVKPCCDGDYIGEAAGPSETLDIASLLVNATRLTERQISELYDRTAAFTIGPLLRTIDSIWIVDESTQIAKVTVRKDVAKGGLSGYLVDPLALCSCYCWYVDGETTDALSDRISIPLTIENITVRRRVPAQFFVLITRRVQRTGYVSFDAKVVTDTGEVVASMENASLKEVREPASFLAASSAANDDGRQAMHVRARAKASEQSDVAIIGISGRYPGASNVEEYWENLKASKDCISEVPESRWRHSQYFDPEKGKPGKTYSKWGGFLDDVDCFDPLFFSISRRETWFMDPKERLFLETVWHLFEGANVTRQAVQEKYGGQVGVYVGATYQERPTLNSDAALASVRSIGSICHVANRVSQYFGLRGPSIAVDTMCSASAVAVHMACEYLQQNENHLALAGGVNLSMLPEKYIGLSYLQVVGSSASSRSFCDGDGYLPSEAVGAILLKPLRAATRDGDHILAVIKSTATNHSGRSSGYGIPSLNAQADVMRACFDKARIAPDSIGYVEAAANGSSLGDAIEVEALKKAFGHSADRTSKCPIGSAKSYIGHAEAASGMTQIAKVVLQLRHKTIIPTIGADGMNPRLKSKDSPFYLPERVEEWPARDPTGGDGLGDGRRALINSFGAGGSGACLIVEEYATTAEDSPLIEDGAPQIAVFSAKDADALELVVQNICGFVELATELSLPRLAYTLQMGREPMPSRLALVVSSITELGTALQSWLRDPRSNPEGLPLYRGDLDSGVSELDHLLSGEAGDAFIRDSIAHGDMRKIALLWSRGIEIPWHLLHGRSRVRMISIPTYPFRREKYPITAGPEGAYARDGRSDHVAARSAAERHTEGGIGAHLVDYLCADLGFQRSEVKVNSTFRNLGLESISALKLLRDIHECYDVKVTTPELEDHQTVSRLADLIERRLGEKPSADIERLDDAANAADSVERVSPQRRDAGAVQLADTLLLEKFRRGEASLEETKRHLAAVSS